MGYIETINCPHCHEGIELEVDIEGSGDDAYAVIKPIELERMRPEPHDRMMDDKATACVRRWRHACSGPTAPTSA